MSNSINFKPQKKKTKVSASQRYEKKTQREHILLRPDSYVGGIDKIEREEWVPPLCEEDNTKVELDVGKYTRFQKRKVEYCPAAGKIWDELLVNALDITRRDEGVTQIKVTINKESGELSVWNNCTQGIPIELHETHGVYIPEMIFGQLLSGENFKDNEAKITGGRNGYGAKVSNIYSKKFQVDCTDVVNRKRFQQTFTDNMSKKEKAKVTKYSGAKAYVKITFIPDYQRLGGMKGMEEDFIALAIRRVFDISACTSERVKVYLNGKMIKVRGMEKYMDYFLGPKKETKRVLIQLSNQLTNRELKKLCDDFEQTQRERGETVKPLTFTEIDPNKIYWEVGLVLSKDGFQQTSFVNGIHTHQGGTHIKYISDMVVRNINKYISSKKKNKSVKPAYIRENLWVFVNATVINPNFGGQTKADLTLKPSKFFYKCKIPESFIEEFDRKCKIMNTVIQLSDLKDNLSLKQTDGKKQRRIRGLPKLEDANWAGTPKSKECTLILTEGDSAKTMAMTGLRIIGKDKFGIFPLRGKLINPEGKSNEKLSKNKEYIALKKIIGLKEDADYSTEAGRNGLRYGKIMWLTDQDLDGFHIKGLGVNLIKKRFPSLMKSNVFECFITPIVRAQRNNPRDVKLFYNLSDFEKWKRDTPPGVFRSYSTKYLKGLGTTEPKEALEYFKDFETHRKRYVNDNEDETKKAFKLAFEKDKGLADDRKKWLSTYDPDDILDYSAPEFSLRDLIYKELKHFSSEDNVRSIASVLDGFKPAHRKIIWAMRKRGVWDKTAKVSQLAGMVSEKSDYHHGEAGLAPTIIGMAQNYVGSNNLNLLFPSGQFGSRVSNGGDSSAPRYLFSRLESVVKHLFPKADDPLLEYNVNDTGNQIEPKYFVPILPVVLANGCVGIGTGYSTSVPMFNPLDIIQQITEVIDSTQDEDQLEEICKKASSHRINVLTPYYRLFKGKIDKTSSKAFTVRGVWERVSNNSIKITELPVGPKTQSYDGYKEFLESSLLENKPKTISSKRKSTVSSASKRKASVNAAKYFIKDYVSNTNDVYCDYTVSFQSKKALDDLIRSGELESKLKLQHDIQLTNMHLFDKDYTIKRYKSTSDIIKEFFDVRMRLYFARKEYLLKLLQRELDILSSKARFLDMIINDKLVLKNIPKQNVIAQLEREEFPKFDLTIKNFEPGNVGTPTYKYLLSLPVLGMTKEEIERYRRERDSKLEELNELRSTDPRDIWKKELQELKEAVESQTMALKKSLEVESTSNPKTKIKRKRKK